jgi:hypothetical protein
MTLFSHALWLHQQTPDKPLPRDGEPYPDEERRRRETRPQMPRDHNRVGMDVARIIDEHLADPATVPSRLADAFHGVYVPIHHNEHIVGAAQRAPEDRAREAGRWLVRHGTDALIWLAERVTGWGRVYVVEALCRLVDDHPSVRPWLLRRAVDGHFLNGYFAGQVAREAELHDAVTEFGDDAELLDHTTRLLHVMTYYEGMGTSLRRYPHGVAVLEAHARHAVRLRPTVSRYFAATSIAHYLARQTPDGSDEPGVKARWEEARTSYLTLLDRDDWCDTAQAGLASGDDRMRWLADAVAPELNLSVPEQSVGR